MFRSRFLLTAVVAVATALAAPAVSEATFSLYIVDDQGHGSLVTPEYTTSDNTWLNHTVHWAYTGGAALDITVSGASNSPGDPTGTHAYLSQTTTEIKANGNPFNPTTVPAVKITIFVVTEGFALTPLHGDLTTSLNPENSANYFDVQNVTGQSFIDSSAVGTSISVAPPTTTQASALNQVSFGSSFTLGNEMVITLGKTSVSSSTTLGSVTLTTAINAAPAPAGMMMVAGMLPFAGLLHLRRRVSKKSEVATAA